MALFHQIKRAGERLPKVRFSGDTAGHQRDQAAAQAALDTAGADPAKVRGRKPDPNAKKLLTLRLDPDVIEHFKATGEGWQTRMNEALRKAAGL